MIVTKRCPQCGETKSIKDFGKNRSRYDGHMSWCKVCSYAAQKERRRNTPKTAASRKARYATNIKSKYGITIEQYDEKFEAQDGLCAICGKPETRTHKGVPMRLCVDHNHDTGEVRKLLCFKCNFAVGLVYEDHDILLKLSEYIRN